VCPENEEEEPREARMTSQKTRKIGIAPTLVVLVLVFGLAMVVGTILLLMLTGSGIEHRPEQSLGRAEITAPGPALSISRPEVRS